MNLIGKIFVGLIAALSVCFFALTLFLWNSQASWRQVAEEKDQLVKTINDENQKIKSAISALNARLDETLGAKAEATEGQPVAEDARKTDEGTYFKVLNPIETQYNQVLTDNQSLWKNRIGFESKLQELIFIISANDAVITENRGLVDKFGNELKTAQKVRAVFLKNLTETTSEKYKQEGIIADITSRNEKLSNDFDVALAVLERKGLDLKTNIFKTKPAYPVQGQIEEIQQGNSGLIMITIGSNDGLIPNHILEVSRNGSYLGRVKILTTEPNRSVCQIIPEYRRGTMREGDLVSSNLKKASLTNE